jgi:PAS domain S-box-containing protein
VGHGPHYPGAVVDAHRSVIGASTIARDTSERKRAAENLRFRALLDAAPDAMVINNDTGTILLTNAETERMFGYTDKAIIGESVEMLIPARYRGHHPGHRRRLFGTPRRRAMGAGLDLWGRRENGSEFPVEISLSPLQTDPLRAHGYAPRLADSGAEGVRLAAQEQPNLILLDIRMPGIDGYEVVEAPAGLEGTGIVAVTASAMPEDRQPIAAAGFNGYIQKPIDVDGFIEEIERLPAQAAVATGG